MNKAPWLISAAAPYCADMTVLLRQTGKWAAAGCVIAAIALAVYQAMFPLRLVVEGEPGLLLSKPAFVDDSFQLAFIHSVHRTLVLENFKIIGAGMVTLETTEFESYGVGMPSLPSEGRFEQIGGRFRLSGLQRKFGEIPLRVGPEAKLTLRHGGEEYPLYQWLPAGSLVKVRTEPNRPWRLFDRWQVHHG